MDRLLSIEKVSASYNGKQALKDVSLEVRSKDFIGVIGPNGGGKTTLLKLIMGLKKPDSGRITFGIRRRQIGYLPQGNAIDPRFPISVKEVVASGLGGQIRGIRPGKEKMLKVEEVLEKVGMRGLRSRPVGELSGGELQRTLLARTIVSSPALLVLDEPETHVDNRFEMELYQLLRNLNEDMGILLVSHDIGTISTFIKSIACVNGELHYHPSNEISNEQLKVYNCPIEIITHGTVPHRVMKSHNH